VDASAAAVAPFAEAASNQLDEVIALTDALLGLARPAREPVEIGIEARRIVILLSAAVRADGRQLTIEEAAYGALGVTSAPGTAVRLAICECLLAAVDAGMDIHCSATGESNRATMRIEVGGNATLAVDDDAMVAAADAGVHIQAERSAISIGFPR
jgi:hypothetical protein